MSSPTALANDSGIVSFEVLGVAQPQGSTRSFKHPRTGAIITTSTNPKVRPWRQAIAAEAVRAGCVPLEGAVNIVVSVWLPRPKGHYGKKGLLPSAPKSPAVRPDIDKIGRAVLDALTGIAYRDDAQVARLLIQKDYCGSDEPPSTCISVTPY